MTEIHDADDAAAYAEGILVGDRVRLRGVRDADLPTMAGWETDPASLVTTNNRVLPPSEAAATERLATWCANTKSDVTLAIETLGDPSVLIGFVSLRGANPKDRCATLGITLGREHTGRGYGTDAMRVMVGYAFRELGLHRIQLEAASYNLGAIRVYEKVGFVLEGRRRAFMWHDGRWYDQVIMAILDVEWAARRAEG